MGNHLAMMLMLVLITGTSMAKADTITVTIDKMAFHPADITAKVGDKIEWVNKDVLMHTATVNGGWEVVLPPKKTVSQVMEKAETSDYYCRFHPNMKGRITVLAQ